MTDARPLADDAVHHLDRLAAAVLDDVGDGPTPAAFAGIAAEVREAVGKVGVPEFNEVTALIAAIGDSMVAGSIDWSPSLGGTLMASVDDLRTLVTRAAQFNAEDSEHLHQRAAELAVYAQVTRRSQAIAMPIVPDAVEDPAAPAPPPTPEPTKSPASVVDMPANDPPAVAEPAATARDASSIVPISSLFYSEGPQVISGGVPTAASAKSDLLGAAVDALDGMSTQPFAAPSSTGPTMIVPVETLIYRGRAALERAAAIREQIKASGASAAPAALDEMYDLIGLALQD